MPRYIDADKFKNNLEKAMEKMHLIGGVKGVDVGAVIVALDRQPTAEVVPKSEVEALQEALSKAEADVKNYMKVAEYQQNLSVKRYHEIKRLNEEVERLQEKVNRYKRYYFHHDFDKMFAEVFDKLDRFINSNCIEIKDERGIKGYVTSGVHFAIAELKKKYTEGEYEVGK